ncbi:MAG: AglZ/HisF2 family acetamidino modification protein [Dehalococcoidia bacterium]|nr:AglZ/HisF2 family acetamidino modification protein [Dehalococcoidia bacterium]
MRTVRVIPVLLLHERGLVKTRQFSHPAYLGDPINIVKIFNDKEVDELILLDITATVEKRPPQFEYLKEIVSECFMPVCYGGGLRTIEDVKRVFDMGVEKVATNSYGLENPGFVSEVAGIYGSQSMVVSLDAKMERFGGYELRTHGGRKRTGLLPVQFAREMEAAGAGEILLNSIDRDGTMHGYDMDLIRQVASAVSVPLIACGGAGKIEDLYNVVKQGGAAAAAAGSMFVYQGRHRAVLISYPSYDELEKLFAKA